MCTLYGRKILRMKTTFVTMATRVFLLCLGILLHVHLFCNGEQQIGSCEFTVQMVGRCHGPLSDVTFTKDGRNPVECNEILPGVYQVVHDCRNRMPVIAVRTGCQSKRLPGVSCLVSMNCFDPEGDGCQNGGTCRKLDPPPGYQCDCLVGFTGPNCETNINDCAFVACLNGGTCVDGVNTFSCTCPVGFSGIQCANNIDDCTSNSCHNGGVCYDGVNSFTCICLAGYGGPHCEINVEDCSATACANGGTCIDGINAFTCCCDVGYTGTTCQNNIGDCMLDSCHGNGVCADGGNSFTCTCNTGYTGVHCQTNVEDCSETACANGGTCIDGVNTFTCCCDIGYNGDTCQTNIEDCKVDSCHGNGVCADGVNSFTCMCNAGYTGEHCQINIDDCSATACTNGGTCIAGVNDFTCCCDIGYTGDTCQTNIEDCKVDSCHGNGVCADGVNSFTCTCTTGYTGDHCQINVNDCSTNACANGGTCIDGVNEFTCCCDIGYTGDTCQTNIEDCKVDSCHGNGVCADGVNSFTCTCTTGYTGDHCHTNVNDCSATACANGGTCIDGVNDFTCCCDIGYNGDTCQTNIEDCTVDSCHGNGVCADGVNSFTCTCNAGYTGDHCHINIDDCSPNPCTDGGICVDGIDSFQCICPADFPGADTCLAKWTKVFANDASGAVVFGDRADLIRAVTSGSDVRISIGSYATNLQNVKPLNDHLCAQALFHIHKAGALRFGNNNYWWFTNLCTTGSFNNARYYVGSAQNRGDTRRTTSMEWFVRPSCGQFPIFRVNNAGSVVHGSVADVVKALKNGHSMRITSAATGYTMPADFVEFNTAETEVVAQALWHVSETVVGNRYVFQPNAFWRFAIWSTRSDRHFSRWTVGDHVNRGDTTDTEPTEWFSDPCWELAYRHDAQGNQLEGSLAGLLTAIDEGHRVRVLYQNSIIKATDLKIRNGHVNAQLIDIVSKQGLDEFNTNVYWDWRLVSTTGSVRTIKYLVGINTEVSPQILTTEAISWFVDTLPWKKTLEVAAGGAVTSGTKAALVQAYRNGAEMRCILEFPDKVVNEPDNLAITGDNIAGMHVRSISTQDVGSSEVEFQINPFWWFTLALTTGQVHITRWTVGIHQERGRTLVSVGSTWFILE